MKPTSDHVNKLFEEPDISSMLMEAVFDGMGKYRINVSKWLLAGALVTAFTILFNLESSVKVYGLWSLKVYMILLVISIGFGCKFIWGCYISVFLSEHPKLKTTLIERHKTFTGQPLSDSTFGNLKFSQMKGGLFIKTFNAKNVGIGKFYWQCVLFSIVIGGLLLQFLFLGQLPR